MKFVKLLWLLLQLRFLVGFKLFKPRVMSLVSVRMGRASVVRAETRARVNSAKSKNYNSYAKRILAAVKAGGADLNINKQLVRLLDQAKEANVPKEIISRNLAKASRTIDTGNMKHATHEFYGHGGIGLLVNVCSDNDNRANGEISHVAKKHGLKPASINSVKFKFEFVAKFRVSRVLSEEELLSHCLECEIDRYELVAPTAESDSTSTETNAVTEFCTSMGQSHALRDRLLSQGLEVEVNTVCRPVEGYIEVNEEDLIANENAIEALEELDDVVDVEHNMAT